MTNFCGASSVGSSCSSVLFIDPVTYPLFVMKYGGELLKASQTMSSRVSASFSTHQRCVASDSQS